MLTVSSTQEESEDKKDGDEGEGEEEDGGDEDEEEEEEDEPQDPKEKLEEGGYSSFSPKYKDDSGLECRWTWRGRFTAPQPPLALICTPGLWLDKQIGCRDPS